ncbi:membrane-spanning 4-domains subfamily A member 4A-like [Melanotaenia boesemani]|uniref:membrane-spanning 4-domains subfamily A member 4A-like n=1 Tax=Melanotaenia boesemani TaxID=1250792 RepID=UPI001C05BE96|nr:membrane-spanning 4-domains subfamily A member 4A-like [Melanotaenia boesemani]XP_041844569.1 membrane-spanning 4-domains subfamily A member 4A-like [Melanotaenia boesemani]
MSSSVVKDKNVTVGTKKADNKSMLPPPNPALCSLSKAMMGSSVVGVLGTVQIMVGLFNIGLGPGRTSMHPYDLTTLGAAYWLGAVFLLAGIVSILADSCYCVCLVGFSVFMNIVGSIAAILSIVLYAIDLSFSIMWLCDNERSNAHNPDSCRYVAYIAQNLLTSMDISLIVLAVLQLCVCISVAVLGIRALCYMWNEKSVRDAETHQPLLKEVLMSSPGA